MSVRLDRATLAADELALAPAPAPRACTDRNFNLPTALHAGFFGLFLAYLAVMGLGFRSPQMILPMAIFVIFTVGFYVVPMLWATMAPAHADRAMPLARLLGEGVDTLTGRTSGAGAVAQVLVLPVLIFGWGLAVVTIAALS
ncbi:hypothetical protein ABDK56_06160 [Sphingomonas sp. ASV193]|uniref:hypothetical protein n=1 Tax=Sphingomonas sp. ASV193 TaxID=3144405 RepID=UPI0032E8B305